jgi:uncharacterized protein (DUF1697 family)
MTNQKQVAFVRGINVGRAKRVAMANLRALLEELGHTGARTLLNSGNAVFTASDAPAEIAGSIEQGLAQRLGVTARVTVLTAEELAVVVAENSLLDTAGDASRLLVAVVGDPAELSRLAPLTTEDWDPESLAVGTRAAYLWCPAGVIAGRLFEAVGRVLGDAVTTRNWATITKLLALSEE